MNEYQVIIYGSIAIALFFDFVNGFHDSANSVATVIGTKVLKPIHAVGIAALAKIGAIVWDLITWYFGLPSSSSHALIGGLVGSALIAGGPNAIVLSGIQKTLIFMVVSPVAGFIAAFAIAIAIMYFFRKTTNSKVNKVFGKLQIASSTFFSLTHGANDGQKTMGVITALLIAGGLLQSKSFAVPIPVIILAASAISLGTFFGGWRIIKTMAFRLTDLKPYQGFCAETGGGAILASMALFGIPVSTTHAIAGSVMGVGATRRLSAVRWGVGKRMVYAWIITIPASAAIASFVLFIIKMITNSQ